MVSMGGTLFYAFSVVALMVTAIPSTGEAAEPTSVESAQSLGTAKEQAMKAFEDAAHSIGSEEEKNFAKAAERLASGMETYTTRVASIAERSFLKEIEKIAAAGDQREQRMADEAKRREQNVLPKVAGALATLYGLTNANEKWVDRSVPANIVLYVIFAGWGMLSLAWYQFIDLPQPSRTIR